MGVAMCDCKDCREKERQKEVTYKIKSLLLTDKVPRYLDIYSDYFQYSWAYRSVGGGIWGDQREEALINHLNTFMTKLLRDKRTRIRSKRCEDCGNWTNPNRLEKYYVLEYDSVTKSIIHICPTCANKYKVCKHCKIATYKHSSTIKMFRDDNSNTYYCGNCFMNHYFKCNECRKILPQSEGKNFGRIAGYPNYWLCKSCGTNVSGNCAMCNEDIFLPTSKHIRGREGGFINVCKDCYNLSQKIIQDFNFKPNKFIKLKGGKDGKLRDDTLLFGFELETEPTSLSVSPNTRVSQQY